MVSTTGIVCKLCGEPGVSYLQRGDVRVAFCSACQREQAITPYELDRLKHAAARINQGRGDHERKLQSGVACKSCGGTTPLPSDLGARSFTCQFCSTELLMSDYIAPELLAAHELRSGLEGMHAAAAAGQRRTGMIILGVVAALVAAVVLAVLLKR